MSVLNLTIIFRYITDFPNETFLKKVISFGFRAAVLLFIVIVLDLFIYCLVKRFKRVHKGVKIFLIAVNVCMFAADLFAIYYFHMPVNHVMIDIILMTNLRESSEFISIYIINRNFWLFIGAAVLVLFTAWKIFTAILRNKKLYAAFMLIIIIISTFAFTREYLLRKFGSRGYAADFAYFIGASRIYAMTSQTYERRQSYDEIFKQAPKDEDVIITQNESTIPYVVFILGESTGRRHMGIYGYNLQTTPNLAERKAQGNLYVFDDVVSPHSSTAVSMQKILTFFRQESPGQWFNYMNLFSVLKSAGYYTVWLSNQEVSINGSISRFCSSICDSSRFTELKDTWVFGPVLDEKIIPLLDDALLHGREKNFYLIHLMGTHFSYKLRYPRNFAKFTVNDETENYYAATASDKQACAEYDNAILYNDYIVNEIIKRFEDKNAIIIYASDHADNVFDDDSGISGHNDGTQNRCMIEIPFLVWTSEKFRESYPELNARIKSSIHRPYMTDDVIHTILDICSISTPDYDPSRSVINPDFNASRKRIYAGCEYTKDRGLIAVQ